MNIAIKVIPSKKQRYPTCGDWWFTKDGSLEIRVSKMANWKFETLVAVHELVEVAICKYQGVSQKSVDEFDMNYEKQREMGMHGPDEEPGDDEEAPYRLAHFWATNLERILAAVLGVDWAVYNRAVTL